MTKLQKEYLSILIVVLPLLVITYSLNFVITGDFMNTRVGLFLGIIRSLLLFFLMFIWSYFIKYRIVVKTTRGYLLDIARLMTFWLFLRMVKYAIPFFFVDARRYLWYCYYIPMLFIPLLSMFISSSLGRSENAKNGKWICAPIAITIILILVVLTNDFHQLVFIFPENAVLFSDVEYDYGMMYYVILIWAVICSLIAIFQMLYKTRVLHIKKKGLIFLPMFCAVLYCYLYISKAQIVAIFFPDMTVFLCIVIVATYEICIASRLIASNKHYEELFMASTLPVYVTDKNYHMYIDNEIQDFLPAEILNGKEEFPVTLDGQIQISKAEIDDGYVFWKENISQINDTIYKLRDASEALKERQIIVREELRTSQEKSRLIETNHIYNEMQKQTEKQVNRMMELIDLLEDTQNPVQEKSILYELTLRGAYFKRRNNLLFLSKTKKICDSQELLYCVKETLSVLELNHVFGSVAVNIKEEISLNIVMNIYDMFQIMIEQIYTVVEGIAVFIDELETYYELRISASLIENVHWEWPKEVEVEIEDDEWILSYRFNKKGRM